MRKRSYIFDRFNRQSGLLQGGDRTFATASRTVDLDIDLFHAELHRLFSTLLGGHLAGERGAFTTTFEIDGTGRGPTESIAFDIGDGHRGIIERRFDMSDTGRDIPSHFLTFRCFCHF